MEISEIAKRLNTTEGAIKVLLHRGYRKIARSGEAENFANVVRLSRLKREAGHGHIRCGSIECRPEKWVYGN